MKVISPNYLKNGKFYVWKEKFAIVKAKKEIRNFFAVIKDDKETTIIIERSKIKNKKDIIKIGKNWKIITLDMVFPFNVVGVTAKIATALAEANVSIMPIAAFSRDHFLVKEKDMEKAIKVLNNTGLTLIDKK